MGFAESVPKNSMEIAKSLRYPDSARRLLVGGAHVCCGSGDRSGAQSLDSRWTVLVTLSGWFLLALGLIRMFAASAYQKGAASTDVKVFMVLEAALFTVGVVITFKSYSRDDRQDL